MVCAAFSSQCIELILRLDFKAHDYHGFNHSYYGDFLLVSLTYTSFTATRPNHSGRFLFPDSPTNAWFLTPAERTTAIQRIKARSLSVIRFINFNVSRI